MKSIIINKFKETDRFLVVVRVHVKRQIVDLVKGFVANDALVGLFDRMSQFVILVVAFLMESFAAMFANERFETGVNSDVRVQRRRSVERFAASRTFVRFFGRVDDFVTTQRRRLTETFAANFANERPGARVHGHVTR